MAKEQSSANLSAEIFATLKSRITRWEYPPEHRFTEEALCEEFGVSRSPIREALRMLVENGLVNKEPYRGYSVNQPDIVEIHDLYQVRLALEVFVVEQLAERGMDLATFDALYNDWQNFRSSLGGLQSSDLAAYDEAFHETLARALGNNVLLGMLHTIAERLHITRINDFMTAERQRETCAQHLTILESIRNKDVHSAREAMRINIENGRENVETAVKEALANAFLGRRRGAPGQD